MTRLMAWVTGGGGFLRKPVAARGLVNGWMALAPDGMERSGRFSQETSPSGNKLPRQRLELLADLNNVEGLYEVAFLDVVEVLDTHTALHSGRNLLDGVLAPLK